MKTTTTQQRLPLPSSTCMKTMSSPACLSIVLLLTAAAMYAVTLQLLSSRSGSIIVEREQEDVIDVSSVRRRRLLNMGIELERKTYKVPYYIQNHLVNWDNLERSVETKDTPIFWHVLKSGGSSIKLMYTTCYHLVGACETGVLIDRQQQEALARQQQHQAEESGGERRRLKGEENQVSPLEWIQKTIVEQWQVWEEPEETKNYQHSELHVVEAEDGRKYVNVDVTTMEGIARASRLNFASSGLADIIFTPLLRESAELLLDGDNHKGRMFAVFRPPVDRIVSLFYYLQQATWEPTYNPQYASMTIDEYAYSSLCESNWMVRSLVNKMEGPLEPTDIAIAKEIIRQKCVVGLVDKMNETIHRFHAFFGFENDDALTCALRNFAVAGGSQTNSHKHPKLDPNGDTWQVIAGKNRLDMILFEYALELWQEQGEWMKNENIL